MEPFLDERAYKSLFKNTRLGGLHVAPFVTQNSSKKVPKRVPKGVPKWSQNDPLGALGAHLGTISKNDPYFFPQGPPKGPKMDPKMEPKRDLFLDLF